METKKIELKHKEEQCTNVQDETGVVDDLSGHVF